MTTRARWIAAPIAAALLFLAGHGFAQTNYCTGGSFTPACDYVLTGQWFWKAAAPFVFEGTTDNTFETTLAIEDPTTDGTWTLPSFASPGNFVGTSATQTLTNKTLTAPALGAATGTSLAVTGAISSSGAASGIGYATGAGCAVTQITNRTTGVTCTGVSGAITTHTASLAAEATADFTVTNTSVAIGDVVMVSIRSGSNSGGTIVSVATVAAGSFVIRVHNGNVAAGTAETGAIVLNFAVIKAVSA